MLKTRLNSQRLSNFRPELVAVLHLPSSSSTDGWQAGVDGGTTRLSLMVVCLALENSCDETAAALVVDGQQVVSEVVASQADDCAARGGVVPEIVARGHVALLPTVVDQVLQQASLDRAAIDCIGVAAYRPGRFPA